MVTVIDKFGRIVIPKKIRNDLGLIPGGQVVLEEQKDTVVIKRPKEETPLGTKKGILIYRGRITGDIAQAVEKIREERLTDLSSW